MLAKIANYHIVCCEAYGRLSIPSDSLAPCKLFNSSWFHSWENAAWLRYVYRRWVCLFYGSHFNI